MYHLDYRSNFYHILPKNKVYSIGKNLNCRWILFWLKMSGKKIYYDLQKFLTHLFNQKPSSFAAYFFKNMSR